MSTEPENTSSEPANRSMTSVLADDLHDLLAQQQAISADTPSDEPAETTAEAVDASVLPTLESTDTKAAD